MSAAGCQAAGPGEFLGRRSRPAAGCLVHGSGRVAGGGRLGQVSLQPLGVEIDVRHRGKEALEYRAVHGRVADA